MRNHICFLRKCKKYDVLPEGFNLKFPSTSSTIKNILKKASMKIMKEELSEKFRERARLECSVNNKTERLKTCCPDFIELITKYLQDNCQSHFEKIKQSQISKFDRLFNSSLPNLNNHANLSETTKIK